MNLLKSALCAALMTTGFSGLMAPALAQGSFSPAITVNDGVITNYEIDQRMRFNAFIGRIGDLRDSSSKELIDDRLKQQAAAELGVTVNAEQLRAGMEEFAGRADLKLPEFLTLLRQGGVDETTFQDFVRVGLQWRTVVSARFRGRVQITDEEVDAALGSAGQAGLQVLLSEVILPTTAENREAAFDLAEQISNLPSQAAFEDAAARFSAAPSREARGNAGWVPIGRLPGQLRSIVLEMRVGQTSDPIDLGNAVAVIKLRGIDETRASAQRYAAIEYGILRLPGGRSAETLAKAAALRGSVDTCDDLYGVNFGQPDELLTVEAKVPSEIPQSIALELAKLDRHEVSTALTSTDGTYLLFLMLCGRTTELNEELSREEVLSALQNRRLGSYADGYLGQLRSEAVITYR